MRQTDGTEALARVRQLRRSATDAEKLLWQHLRSRRLKGHKFRRQVWIGPYIADFLCNDAALVIELDGSQHVDQADYDAARSAYLEEQGLTVLRFWNNDVLGDVDAVLTVILAALERVPSPSHSLRERAPPSP